MSKMKMYDALPPYFGGKRKLNPTIFSFAPSPAEAPRFVDAFIGGGSVSLYAKARGYQVFNNDLGQRSAIIGRALIENNKTRLTEHDVQRLFIETDGPQFVQENFVPEVFMSKHGEFIDNALAYIDQMDDGPKKELLRLLMIKYIFFLRPYSKFSSPNAFNLPMEERRIEYIKQKTYHSHIKAALEPIIESLERIRKQINSGIMDNGVENRTNHGDVLEFMPGVEADVAYFDPPYANTLAYEEEYHILDQILRGETFKAQKSGFSTEESYHFIDQMLERSQHIPIWILSFGNGGGKNDIQDLVRIMEKYKEVEAYKLKYQHIAAVATKEHREKSEEFIVIGRPKIKSLPN